MPTLYVVATPIGNLGDMTPRAIETLKSVSLIAAEDTRVTQKLLSAFDIHTPLTSCHEHNERGKAAQIVRRMLEEDIDVAVTTDAGTPCIFGPRQRAGARGGGKRYRDGGRAGPDGDGSGLERERL